MTAAVPRKTPCGSCPYRQGVPSGVWAHEEYEVLRRFDGSTAEQAQAGAFRPLGCHQVQDGELCAGWAGCHDMGESLAARIGVASGQIDPGIVGYTTDVPLFGSGAEAADHGQRDVEYPSAEARAMSAKVTAARASRGNPVRYS